MGTAVLTLFSLLALLFPVTLPRTVQPVETVEELQRRFDAEPDGVNKAKLLRKLGEAQFQKERTAAKAGDYESATFIMEKYRDNVRAALQAVEKVQPDGEKHPNGYKQLEIHLEDGLREIDDLLATAPDPYRPPLELVKADLLALDKETLRHLFPRRPGEKPLPPKTPAAQPPQEKKT